jgi:hypothetical protein
MSEFRVTRKPVPSPVQRAWLKRGLDQPGGKLPLFDRDGQQIDPRTIQACVQQGWAAPWFDNPIKPDWLVCKLTEAGRAAISRPRTLRPPVVLVPVPAAAKPLA